MAEPAQLRKFLVSLRLAVGVGAIVMPRTLARLFGINPSLPLIVRFFGIREALMAYQLYQASDDELEEILRQGIMVDGADIVAVFLALLRANASFRTFVLVAATGGAAMAAGILGREQPARSTPGKSAESSEEHAIQNGVGLSDQAGEEPTELAVKR